MIAINKIISGGQTGADRAALDFAIAHDIQHGGWCPKGRKAEDGEISLRYRLSEMATGAYLKRTKQNIAGSDITLILNLGKLDGGTLKTWEFAQQANKPCRIVQLDEEDIDKQIEQLCDWLRATHGGIWNVAGPRESKRPGIYRQSYDFLAHLLEQIGIFNLPD